MPVIKGKLVEKSNNMCGGFILTQQLWNWIYDVLPQFADQEITLEISAANIEGAKQ